MSKRITQEEYISRVYKIWGDEYSVLDEFINSKTKMHFQHNKCGCVIESLPHAFLRVNAKCPVCSANSKNMTTDILRRKIREKSGDDYELLSDFKSMTDYVMIRHNNCCCDDGFYVFKTTPKNFLEHTGLCPKERHKGTKLTIMDIQSRLKHFHNDYRLLSTKYDNPNDFLTVECNRGHQYQVKIDGICMGTGCPICNNKVVLRDYNDYCFTHPNQAKYLNNYEDGYKITYGTNDKVQYKCPICGLVTLKKPTDAFNNNGKYICVCNDHISYPEKFMFSVLTQSGEDFIYQLTKAKLDWCKSYRYDFYLPRINTIIEVHGKQHDEDSEWGTLEDIQINDYNKQLLAEQNGVNYIVIDARISNLEFIKTSIIQSLLPLYINLEMINWNKCNTFANKSIYFDVIQMWKDDVSINDICKRTKLSSRTILGYLEDAGNNNLCQFDRKQYQKTVRHGCERIPVKCIETNRVFNSFADVKRELKIVLSSSKIKHNNYIKGFHWELI